MIHDLSQGGKSIDTWFDTAADLRQTLAAHGFRVTHQRLEILRSVRALPGHPTVTEVFQAVRRNLPTVSIDTVYRTLWTFSDLGLLHPVTTQGEAVRFDADLHPHHHFTCTRCGSTTDFRNAALDALEIPEEARRLGAVSGYIVEVRGICSRCAERETPGRSRGPEKGAGHV